MSWLILPAGDLPQHAEAWRALNSGSAASPLLDLDFVLPLLDAFASGDELLVIYQQDGRALAMGIVAARRLGVWETFQPSQAPLGLWLQDPALDTAPLLDQLIRKLPGTPLILSLTQRDPRLAPRPPDSPLQHSIDYIDTAHIVVEGSFDDYWQARGKNLRSNLKKQRGRLLKENVTTRLQLTRAPLAMAEAVREFGLLESAGWKAGRGTALHAENAQGRFYQRMLERFAGRNAACVYRYWFGEQLVAMDLCVEGDGLLIVLKTSYDEDVAAGLSPTLLMREECCRQFFDDARFGRVEFYGRVMEWHTRWTSEVRTMYHLNHYRWSGLLKLHSLAHTPPALYEQLRARLAPRPPQPARPTLE